MYGVKSVSRHEEASAGGGSFVPQSGWIAQQNLAIRVSRTTCFAIITNFPSEWFYQDHRWSLIYKYVIFNRPGVAGAVPQAPLSLID